jgi:hypothetical protein
VLSRVNIRFQAIDWVIEQSVDTVSISWIIKTEISQAREFARAIERATVKKVLVVCATADVGAHSIRGRRTSRMSSPSRRPTFTGYLCHGHIVTSTLGCGTVRVGPGWAFRRPCPDQTRVAKSPLGLNGLLRNYHYFSTCWRTFNINIRPNLRAAYAYTANLDSTLEIRRSLRAAYAFTM